MLWLLTGAAAIITGATSTRTGDRVRWTELAARNGYPSTTAALRSWLPGAPARDSGAAPAGLIEPRPAAEPIGNQPPEKPERPDLAGYQGQRDYRRVFEKFFGSREGKEVHHAIEQQIFDRLLGIFREIERHDPRNLRGIPGPDKDNTIHRGPLRDALDTIYAALADAGIIPERDPKGQFPFTMFQGPDADRAREALLFAALLVDVFLGDFFSPPTGHAQADDLEDFLRALGLTDNQIAAFNSLTPAQRARLLTNLIDNGLAAVIPGWQEYFPDIERLAPQRPSVDTQQGNGTGPSGAYSSEGNGSLPDIEQSTGQQTATRLDRDVDNLATALTDLRTAQENGDSTGYANAQQRLNDAANQLRIDKAADDISNALTKYQAAMRSGDSAAQARALHDLNQASDRFQALTNRGPGDHIDPRPAPGQVWDQPGSSVPLPDFIKPAPDTTGPGIGGIDQAPDTNPNIKPIPTTPTKPPVIGYIGDNWRDIPSDNGPDIQT